MQATTRKKRPETREESYGEIERRWQATAQPPKTAASVSTIIPVVVLAVLCVAAYMNRARIGALRQQIADNARSQQVAPSEAGARRPGN